MTNANDGKLQSKRTLTGAAHIAKQVKLMENQ